MISGHVLQVIAQPNTVYESIQFRLEDEAFDSVADLVTCYVGSNKPVTMATGARITTPVNRQLPLSAVRRGTLNSSGSVGLYAGGAAAAEEAPPLPSKHQPGRYATQSLPRPSALERIQRKPRDLGSDSADPAPSTPSSPPKPSRMPSQIVPEESQQTNTYDVPRIAEVAEALDVVPQLAGCATFPRLRRTSKTGRIRDRPLTETRNSFLDRRSCDLEVEASFTNCPIPAEPPDDAGSDSGIQHPPADEVSISRDFPSLFQLETFQVRK